MTSQAENKTTKSCWYSREEDPGSECDRNALKRDLRKKLKWDMTDLDEEAGQKRSFIFCLLAILKKTSLHACLLTRAQCLLCLEHSNQVRWKSRDD